MKWWHVPLLIVIGGAVWAAIDPEFRALISELVDTYLAFLLPNTTTGYVGGVEAR